MALSSNTIEEFKSIMNKMQDVRRHIVTAILSANLVKKEWIQLLQHTYNVLNDANTQNYQREMLGHNGNVFSLNVRDEILGLKVSCYSFCL